MSEFKDAVRISLRVHEELLKEVDEYAKSLHINRTSAVNSLLSLAIKEYKHLISSQDLMSRLEYYDKDKEGNDIVVDDEGNFYNIKYTRKIERIISL